MVGFVRAAKLRLGADKGSYLTSLLPKLHAMAVSPTLPLDFYSVDRFRIARAFKVDGATDVVSCVQEVKAIVRHGSL
jgi:hypothetical protein